MGFETIIQGILNMMMGQGQQQQAPGQQQTVAQQSQQQNVAGGTGTANQMPAQPPQQAPAQQSPQPQQLGGALQGNGIGAMLSSPLAQSLMAGYFGAIGAPKLSGWGGALSRGGLTALNQYGEASALDQRQQALANQQQEAQSLSAYRQQEAALQKQKLDMAQAAAPFEQRKTEAEAKLAESKYDQSHLEKMYNPATGDFQDTIRGSDHEAALASHGYKPFDEYNELQKTQSKETTADKLQAKKDMADAAMVSEDDKHDYLDPRTLQPIKDSTNVSVGDAKKNNLVVSKKEGSDIREIQTNKMIIDQLKGEAGNVFYAKKDMPLGNTYGAGIGVAIDKRINPENYSNWKTEIAALAGLPRKFIGGNRMNLTEWNGVMNELDGFKSGATDVEAVNRTLDRANAILDRTLKAYSPEYGKQDTSTSDNFADKRGTGEQKSQNTPSPTNPNFQYQSKSGTPFGRLPDAQ